MFQIEIDCKQEVVVYDQSSKDVTSLSSDCFLTVLLAKLEKNFSSVYLLSGTLYQEKKPKHLNKEKKENAIVTADVYTVLQHYWYKLQL